MAAKKKRARQLTGEVDPDRGPGRVAPAGPPRRLKVGEAIERWADGEDAEVTGRITFQLEQVYNWKTLASGKRKRYGPFGPYWYVYYWTGDATPAMWDRPGTGGRPDMRGRGKWRSRYLGKPDDVDPSTVTASQLGKLLKEKPGRFGELRTGVDWEAFGRPRDPAARSRDARPVRRPLRKPVAPDDRWGGLTLIGCGKDKQGIAAPARDLYSGTWFKKVRRFAEKREATYDDPWFILSAKHGLTEPGDVIEPYDLTLNKMSSAERKAWALRVWTQLQDRGFADRKWMTILAGARYTDALVPILRDGGVIVELPLQGMSIGKQLKWLNSKTGSGEWVSYDRS